LSGFITKEDIDLLSENKKDALKKDAEYYLIYELRDLIDDHIIIPFYNTNNFNEGIFAYLLEIGLIEKIRIEASKRRGDEIRILNRESQVYQLMSIGSWIMIDLSDVGLVEIHSYTIRNRGDRDRYALRNWKLEGSKDSRKWNLLIKHDNDCAIGEPVLSIGTWTVNSKEKYSYFKLTSTGVDSTGCAFLNLSNIEFYGNILYILLRF